MALKKIAVYDSWRLLDPGPDHPIDVRFAAMPPLTKKDIREHFPLGMLPPGMDINSGLAGKEIELVDTSGTTEEKITNIWNQKWWDASERSSWRFNAHFNRVDYDKHREAILSNPRNTGVISDELDLPMDKRRLARFLYLNEKTDPTTWSEDLMNRMVMELGAFQPEVLEANPSLLAMLCRFIGDNNLSVFQPDVIVFTYEYTTRIERRQIKQIFSSPMISSYGTTETGYVFTECEAGRFHQNPDFCRVDFEPFRKEYGGPRLGRILVTPFDNPWCYFIRFDAGDLVTLEESGQCPCGRNSGIILSSINGRKANLTLTVEGRPVTLFELDESVSRVDGIEQFKLIQNDHRTYELHLVSRTHEKKQLVQEAEKALKGLYGPDAIINIIFDTDFPPEVSGKSLISRALFPIDLNDYLE
jgi:phenylacetate-coenzyme A ligase PaaK-like adenylate-forming protein